MYIKIKVWTPNTPVTRIFLKNVLFNFAPFSMLIHRYASPSCRFLPLSLPTIVNGLAAFARITGWV